MKENKPGQTPEQEKALTNEQIIERVNAWQNAGFIHPLTCRWSSKHSLLFPFEVDGKIVLRCPDCKMPHQDQLNIPQVVLSITPELINEEKQRLIEKGFKF